jgi:hypothetical protein
MAAAGLAGVEYGTCDEANPAWVVRSISWLPPGLGYKLLDILIGITQESAWSGPTGSCLQKTDECSIRQASKESNMLWTICVVLLILWLLGFVSGYTMGGFIHILLVIAIIVVLVRVIQGRRAL